MQQFIRSGKSTVWAIALTGLLVGSPSLAQTEPSDFEERKDGEPEVEEPKVDEPKVEVPGGRLTQAQVQQLQQGSAGSDQGFASAAEQEFAPTGEQEFAPTGTLSLRSQEFLKRNCYNSLGQEELTLFGNGTLRIRTGLGGELQMWLAELDPREFEAFQARLEEMVQQASAQRAPGRAPGTVKGSWVERCELSVNLPETPQRTFHYGKFDTVSPVVRRFVDVANELRTQVDLQAPPEGQQQLPEGYRPTSGDLLRRQDGTLFEVIGLTANQLGVELQGRGNPMTVYVALGDLRREFIALESASGRTPY